MRETDVESYLLARRAVVGECWEWTGPRDAEGYGRAKYDRRSMASHRMSYATFIGDLEPGLHVDHLCRNVACFNPEHLEQVTPQENHRRQRAALRQAEFSTHCGSGHELNEVNRYEPPSGGWQCRTCNREKARRHYWQRKSA